MGNKATLAKSCCKWDQREGGRKVGPKKGFFFPFKMEKIVICMYVYDNNPED